ncbi:MAG: hypothetical protein ACM3O3_11555 [Syntrophothermus sp.]
MLRYSFIVILLSFLFISCNNDNNIIQPEQATSIGSISLAFDKVNIPPNVVSVKVKLTRSSFDPITGMMNLLTDTTAELTLNQIPVGQWHLRVDALDINNNIIFSGETDVTIIENITINVNLVLQPHSSGTGSIKIYVTWGTFPPVNNYSWIDNPGGPVISNNSAHPSIIYENGIYKLWFTNVSQGNIRYAESYDGISWNIRSTPVLKPSLFWDNASVSLAKVIKVNNVYRMYYTARGTGVKVGLAVSNDGINFEKYNNPVLQEDVQEHEVHGADIVYSNSKYYLYYTGFRINGPGIYLATSTDGVEFTKTINPVISITFPWEGSNVYNPSVIYEENKFKMVYLNYSASKLGFAESIDGLNWEKRNEPIFGVEALSNNWANEITNVCYRKLNGEYRIYYCGNSNQYYSISFLTQVP